MSMVMFQDFSGQSLKDFDALILLFEQTMRLEEAFGQLKVRGLRLKERNSRDDEKALLYGKVQEGSKRVIFKRIGTWKERKRQRL